MQPFILVKQGDRGRWRWYARSGDAKGELLANGPIHGFATKEQAQEAADRIITTRMTRTLPFGAGCICGASIIAGLILIAHLFGGSS